MNGNSQETCWADPLNLTERAILAGKLGHACKRFRGGQYAFIGKDDEPRSWGDASAEMADLRLDVTERAGCAERAGTQNKQRGEGHDQEQAGAHPPGAR